MKKDKELQSFIEDLEETVLRLHVWFRESEQKYGQFKKTKKFLGKTGIKRYSGKLREETKAYHEHRYYQGKFYSYLFILEEMESNVPKIIQRLRGMISPGHNELMETKAHYSEVKGHFDTDEYLEYKKVKK